MGDGDNGLALGRGGAVAAVAGDVPVVERPEVALVADGGPGNLHDDGLKIGH